jgi:Fe-S oxidoreductase
LEAASVEVVIPRQVGRAAALVGAGNLAAAQKRNRRNADALRRAVAEGCEAIIAGSPADALTLRHVWEVLQQLDAAEVRERGVRPVQHLQKLAAAGNCNCRSNRGRSSRHFTRPVT